jgi:formylglycine-generating enzyme required for sulfatase activity
MNHQRNLGQSLDRIERELQRIRSLYDRTLDYKDNDPETSLMHARKAAEAICRQLFIKSIGPNPGNLTLEGLLEKLHAAGTLPRSIAVPLRTIQGYGNFAAHDQEADDTVVITPAYIQPCLQALAVVVDWYFANCRVPAEVAVKPAESGDSNAAEAAARVRDFATKMGLTSAAVIRLARDVLRSELRTPSALLTQEQITILEASIRAKASLGFRSAAPKSFDLGGGISMEFVLIEAGTFQMGSPVAEEGHNDDEVEHTVIITRPFYMSRYPVTQIQYQAVLGDNPSYFPGENNPVEMVSWFDAVSFCERLTERFGKRFRLPTEAEWEYACRAGTSTAFFTGNTITTEQANFDGRLGLGSAQAGLSRRSTTAVDTFPPNLWQLSDMHGNVWEWCADWYGAYPQGVVTDPMGSPNGDIRILRGGSWFHGAADARSAQRDALDPGRRHSIYGFRVVFNESGQ